MLRDSVRSIRCAVYGRVRDQATGGPVASARVVIGLRLGEPGQVILAEDLTTDDGLFSLLRYADFVADDTPPGPPRTHRLGVAAGRGYRVDAAHPAWSLITDVTLPDDSVNQPITLVPVTRLGGRATTADGVGVKGALVKAEVYDGGVLSWDLPLTADARGLFELRDDLGDSFDFGTYPVGVPPERVIKIRASRPAPAPEAYGPEMEVRLRPGEDHSVTVRVG